MFNCHEINILFIYSKHHFLYKYRKMSKKSKYGLSISHFRQLSIFCTPFQIRKLDQCFHVFFASRLQRKQDLLLQYLNTVHVLNSCFKRQSKKNLHFCNQLKLSAVCLINDQLFIELIVYQSEPPNEVLRNTKLCPISFQSSQFILTTFTVNLL